jgi:hypothetical protein
MVNAILSDMERHRYPVNVEPWWNPMPRNQHHIKEISETAQAIAIDDNGLEQMGVTPGSTIIFEPVTTPNSPPEIGSSIVYMADGEVNAEGSISKWLFQVGRYNGETISRHPDSGAVETVSVDDVLILGACLEVRRDLSSGHNTPAAQALI